MNPITPLTPAETAQQEQQTAHEGILHRDAVAIDIAANVILLNGQEDETISSHEARADLKGKWWGRVVSTVLGWIQPNHGAKAIAGDLERAQNVVRIEESSGVLNK